MYYLTNYTAKLSPRAVNRDEVLRACLYKGQLQCMIVTIMILFDETDYRLLLHGNCLISFSPRSEKVT